MHQVTIVKRHKKTMSMSIKPDGQVFVYAPTYYPDHKIQQRIESKQDRITRKLQLLAQKQPYRFDGLASDQCVLFDELYTCIFSDSFTNNEFFDTKNKTLVVPKEIQKEVWLRTLATAYLHKRFAFRREKHNCEINKLFIRNQTTKRGTCSSKKNISLNRKLITLPERVIDYVICHELAHLAEMNHGKQFRAHCTRLYPETKRAKKRLKEQ